MRVPVPDERDNSTVAVPPEETPPHVLKRVAGTDNAANVPQAHGYTAEVYRDEDGRYVGVHEDVGPILAAVWREQYDDYSWEPDTTSPDDESGSSDASDDGPSGGSDEADADEPRTDGGKCQAIKNDGEVCGRDLPCPYHDGGE